MEQASKIMGEISAVISKMKFGRKEDLSKLIQLKEKYEMLESGVKKFFDYSLIDKLDDLIVEAQLDQDKDSNS